MSAIKLGKYLVDPYGTAYYFHSDLKIALIPSDLSLSFHNFRYSNYSIETEDIKIRLNTVTPHVFGHQDFIQYCPFNPKDFSINGDILRIYQILDLWKKY